MSGTSVVLKYIVKWVERVASIFLAAFLVAGIFANWRYFPSVDFGNAFRFWPQILIWSLFAGVFHLLPSALLARLFIDFTKIGYGRMTDYIFVVSMIVVPALLALVPSRGFSFGVSEGELIHNGVRTSLGWYAFWMSNLQSSMQMTFYLILRYIQRKVLGTKT